MQMEAVPPDLSPERERLTGLVCPDCEGVLQAKVVGPREHLQFTCRIGHAYALGGLIVAKEVDLEHRAWAAVHAAEEMDALLRDLIAANRVDADTARRFADRRQAAGELRDRLRGAIERDRPVRLPAEDHGASNPALLPIDD
jgi:hypothetical protein